MRKALAVLLVLATGVPALPPAALAAGVGMEEEMLFGDIPTVTLAAKMEENILTSAGTVYVITEEDIRRYGWRDMRDALMAIPNMDTMWQYLWLPGGQRGFNGDMSNTLLLVDGREMNNNDSEIAFLTPAFSLQRVKRIEVLMGPNSMLYGAKAMEGVINIITKAADSNQGDTTEVKLGRGDQNTEDYEGVFRRKMENGSVGAAFHRFRSDQSWHELRTFVLDNDRYRRQTAANYAVANKDPNAFIAPLMQDSMDVNMSYRDIFAGMSIVNFSDTYGIEAVKAQTGRDIEINRTKRLGYAGFKHAFQNGFVFNTEYQNLYQLRNRPGSGGVGQTAGASRPQPDRFDITTHKGLMTLEFPLLRVNNFIVGVDGWHKNRYVNSGTAALLRSNANETFTPSNSLSTQDSLGVVAKRGLSYYIQDSISVLPDRLRLTVGVMRHYEDLVRSKWMPRYSAVWLMNPNSSLKYTYGVGFRANNTTIGNVPGVGAGSTVPPILMYMNEVNYTQAIRGSGFSLTNIMAAYWMESRNAVRRIVNPNPAIPSTVMQTDVITQKGIEDQVQFKAGPRLSGFVGGRVNRQNKRSYATATGVALVAPYSSKYRFRGGLSFDVLKKLATGVTAEHNGPVVGQETDLTGANYEIFKVHGYTCYNFNLRLGDFHPSPNTSVGYSLYVENLTNRTYYTINSRSQQPIQYLQPPRNYRVSLDVKF